MPRGARWGARNAAPASDADLPTLHTLDDLVGLLGDRDDLYLRWSDGPERDCPGASRDELTDVPLPGLSASPLAVEPWWGGRSRRLWAARRLYDSEHLRQGASAWVLTGTERGRGPDNEPLVHDVVPLAWVAPSVVDEAVGVIDRLPGGWGHLDRGPDD
jgi:hypothetical protein